MTDFLISLASLRCFFAFFLAAFSSITEFSSSLQTRAPSSSSTSDAERVLLAVLLALPRAVLAVLVLVRGAHGSAPGGMGRTPKGRARGYGGSGPLEFPHVPVPGSRDVG